MTNSSPIQRRIASFRHAFRGLSMVIRTQPNAWFHLLASLVVVGLGAWLRLSVRDWCLLVLAIAVVMSAEAMNTGIEKLADAIHPDPHPLVGQAKDAAAAAVLLVALGALVVGILVLGPAIADAL